MYRKIMTKICVVWSQGCISVSFQFHRTSFCFVCSHLASGEKEGDELRRNLDVIEILKNTQFPRICRPPYSRIPEKILDHEWVYFSWINAWTAPSIFFFFFCSDLSIGKNGWVGSYGSGTWIIAFLWATLTPENFWTPKTGMHSLTMIRYFALMFRELRILDFIKYVAYHFFSASWVVRHKLEGFFAFQNFWL